MATEQNHHYFASSAFNWATGATRDEAITKLAKQMGADLIKRQVKANAGAYCWTCQVNAPLNMEYTIADFMPKGVAICAVREIRIVNAKGDCRLIDRTPE